MNKLLSRLILWLTALSAVFFTSSVFADTPISTLPYYGSKYSVSNSQANYDTVRTIQWISKSSTGVYSMNSAVSPADSMPFATYKETYTTNPILSFCPSFHDNKSTSYWESSHLYIITNPIWYISPWLVNYSSGGSIVTSKWFAKHSFFYTDWMPSPWSPYDVALSSTGLSATCSQTAYAVRKWEGFMWTSVPANSAVKAWSYNPYTNQYCIDSKCITLTDLATSSSSCSVDNISSGGNCSCKKTGWYSASASWSTALTWKYNWLDVSASITTANTTDAFSSKFNKYYIKLPSGSTFKPDIILGTIDASWIGGTRSVQAIWASTGMIYSDSRTLVSTASANEYSFYTSDGWMLSSTPIVWNITTNSATNDDNTFNSFVINSSSGGFLPIAYNRFSVYYQKGAGWSYSNLADNYTYLGDYLANTMITLPYGQKTRRVKIVPLSTTVYVSWVSPFNTPFTEDQICTVLSGDALTAELASRSSLSGSLAIANVNFCGVALDVPVVWSALGAMCNFVQPYAKSFVSKWQSVVDIINIVPPTTAPTTFDYYPKFTFSGMTMDISTQTGAIPLYSSWSDVNPLKITSDASSSTMKIWVLALISILLYLVIYAVHFWIVAGLVWLLLHISRFFTGFAWKHNSSGNVWSLIPFLAYAWVFFTAILSIVGSISFILPLLLVLRAYALFFIVWLTSFAPWSYALFSGFFTVMFSSIFLIGIFYLVHFLIERFWKLN